MLEGVFGVHQAPPMPPKKVRKFCSFDPLNGELRRQTPMDLKSGITSKTKLPQQKWTHLQNLCIKVDQMAYAKSLEIFMRQDKRNFDMCFRRYYNPISIMSLLRNNVIYT